MRNRYEIETDPHANDRLTLEVLLDIRELLLKEQPKRKYRKHKESVSVNKEDN